MTWEDDTEAATGNTDLESRLLTSCLYASAYVHYTEHGAKDNDAQAASIGWQGSAMNSNGLLVKRNAQLKLSAEQRVWNSSCIKILTFHKS